MKRKFTRQEWALLLSPLLLLLIVFAAQVDVLGIIASSFTDKAGTQRNSCSVNMQAVAITFAQYAGDYDGKLPLAVVDGPGPTAIPGAPFSKPTRTVGWADALITYPGRKSLGGMGLVQCRAEPTLTYDPSQAGYSDFYFNRRLSGLKMASVKQPGLRLLLGEGNDGTDSLDATYSKTSFPAAWLTDENSPAFRHLGGANYVMLDGTVQWLKPEQIATFGGRKDFFAIN